MLESLREDINFFLTNVCMLIARGTLASELTETGRIGRLRRLGFRVEEHTMQPTSILLYVFAVVAGFMVVAAGMLGTGSSVQMVIKQVAVRIVMIACIQSTALAIAIVPKTFWGFANAGMTERTPTGFVVGAGLVAALASVALGLVFRFLMFGSTTLALTDFERTFPWTIMAFTMAATTAFLVQDHRWSSTRRPDRRRFKDALVLAAALAVSIYLVRAVLIACGLPYPASMPGEVLELELIALGMGAAIGYVVPAAVRENYRMRSIDWRPDPLFARLATS